MQLRSDAERQSAMRPDGVSLRLLGFVALSLLIHGLLLLAQQPSSAPPLAAVGSRTISVTLAAAAPQTAEPAAMAPAAVPAKKTFDAPPIEDAPHRIEQDISMAAFLDNETTEPATRAEDRPFSQEVLPPASSQIAESDTLAPDSGIRRNDEVSPKTGPEQSSVASDLRQAQHNFLLGQVRSLLARHLTYPVRARRRGWEGEVLVGFRVDEDGRIGNVHLAHSSGYSLLDESALAALGLIGSIPLAGSSRFAPVELQLPVRYQLREG